MRIEKRVLNDALRMLGKVVCQFKNPRHEEFSAPTRWSLLNAFTETIKKYTPQRVDHSYLALNKCFGLDGNRPELWK